MVGTSSPHTMSDLVAYIDGGSLGNPGPSGIGVVIDGSEAVEHCQFAMIQIRQPKHSATVIRLDSLFAHGHGLPCRRIGTTADRLGDARIGTVKQMYGGAVARDVANLVTLTAPA